MRPVSVRSTGLLALSLTLLLTLMIAAPKVAQASDGDFRVNGVTQKLGIGMSFGRWPDGVVPWAYNPDGAVPVFADNAYFLSLIEAAMDEVRAVANVDFQYQGISSGGLMDFGDNVVVFGWADIGTGGRAGPASSCTGAQLTALGYCQYVDGSFRLANSAGATWDMGDTDITERRVKSVILHELLHLLGLGHSDVFESIMFARPYNFLHHLRPDDIDALVAMYGEAETSGPLMEFVPPGQGNRSVDDSFVAIQGDPFTELPSIDGNTDPTLFLGLFIRPDNADDTYRVIVVDPGGFYHTSKVESYPANGQTQFYFQVGVAQTLPGPWTFYILDDNGALVTSNSIQVNSNPTINQPPESTLTVSATRGVAPLTVDMTLNVMDDPEGDQRDGSWHIAGQGQTTVGDDGSNCAPCGEPWAAAANGSLNAVTSSKSVTFNQPGVYEIYVTVNDNWGRYQDPVNPGPNDPPASFAGSGWRTLYRKVVRVTTAADDVAAMTDVSGDGVPDYATFTDKIQGPPQVLYMSGATGRGYAAQRFLNSLWRGLAITFVEDADGDGNNDDPGIAMLARNASGTIIVQVRRISDGAVTRDIKFLNRLWDAIDLVSVNNVGSGNPGLAVLAQLRGGKMVVEVRRVSNGSSVSLQRYLNPIWGPVAIASADRAAATSLIAVLARLPSGKNLFEMREPDGSFHGQASVLNRIWIARDITSLMTDTGMRGWAVLAKNPNGLKNLGQVMSLDGSTVVNSVTILNKFWDVLRLGATGDINSNSFDELLGFARNANDESNRAIQVIDHSTQQSIDVAKP